MSSGAEQTMDEILDALRSIRGKSNENSDTKSVDEDGDILDLTEKVSNTDLDLTKEPPQISSAEALPSTNISEDVSAAVAGAQIAQSLENTQSLESTMGANDAQSAPSPTEDLAPASPPAGETMPLATANPEPEDATAIIDRLGDISVQTDPVSTPTGEPVTPDSVAEYLTALQEPEAQMADTTVETPVAQAAPAIASEEAVVSSVDAQADADILNLVNEAVVSPNQEETAATVQAAPQLDAPTALQDIPTHAPQEAVVEAAETPAAEPEQAADASQPAPTAGQANDESAQVEIVDTAPVQDVAPESAAIENQEGQPPASGSSDIAPQEEIQAVEAAVPDVAIETPAAPQPVSAPEAVIEEPVKAAPVAAEAPIAPQTETATEQPTPAAAPSADEQNSGAPMKSQADMIAEANAILEAQANVSQGGGVAQDAAPQEDVIASEQVESDAQIEPIGESVEASGSEALDVAEAPQVEAQEISEEAEAPKSTFDRLASLGTRAAGVAAAGAATIGLVANHGDEAEASQTVAEEPVVEQTSEQDVAPDQTEEAPQLEVQESETGELIAPTDASVDEPSSGSEQTSDDKVEKMVMKLLRPALDGWLDRNMPNVLEKALQDKTQIAHKKDDAAPSDEG